MFKLLTPHLQLASVLDICPEMLCALGVEGLLVDLDETLKGYYDNSFRPEIVAWVEQMKREHIRLCIVTNGVASRVGRLADRLGIEYVSWAAKPFPRGVRAGVAKLGLDRTRVALVGDQIFADVIAGRLAGVFTILVRPSTTREPWNTFIKRPLERWVLRRVAAANARVRPLDGREKLKNCRP